MDNFFNSSNNGKRLLNMVRQAFSVVAQDQGRRSQKANNLALWEGT